jgi:hypothetical protein
MICKVEALFIILYAQEISSWWNRKRKSMKRSGKGDALR